MPEFEQQNYYAIIPSSVLYNNELSSSAKLLFASINSLTNEQGFCWASNEYFAERFDISPNRVSHIIADLKNAGLIDIEYVRKDNSVLVEQRRIFVTVVKNNNRVENNNGALLKITNYGCQKQQSTVVKNSKDNNINLNNNIIINNKERENPPAENKEFESLINYYIDNIGTMNKTIEKKLKDWSNVVHISLIQYAIDEAVRMEKKSYSYINAIIRGQHSAGRVYAPNAEKTEPKMIIKDGSTTPATRRGRVVDLSKIKRLEELSN